MDSLTISILPIYTRNLGTANSKNNKVACIQFLLYKCQTAINVIIQPKSTMPTRIPQIDNRNSWVTVY